MSLLLFALAMEPLAEALRSDPGFSGLKIRNQHCKLSLFADYMLLYVMKPNTSLPVIEQTLDSFHLVSGLKVNRENIIPLHLSSDDTSNLKVHSPYSWATDSWRYLGVKIPSHFSNLASVNLAELNKSTKALLKSWNDTLLSWFEKIQLVKMMILPKFLFLFWALPIPLSNTMLSEWQSNLTRFIWQYKTPRIQLMSLCKPRALGGLAFPNLHHYYEAVLLVKILKHHYPSYVADWKDIENVSFFVKKFDELLWIPPSRRPGCKTFGDLLAAPLRVWGRK